VKGGGWLLCLKDGGKEETESEWSSGVAPGWEARSKRRGELPRRRKSEKERKDFLLTKRGGSRSEGVN